MPEAKPRKPNPSGLGRGIANSNRVMAESLGKPYGQLTVVADAGFKVFGSGQHRWRMCLCECDCGRTIETRLNSVRSHNTVCCGICNKHHMTNSSEFGSWSAMRERCDPSNKRTRRNYSDRGITVCDRWCNSFANFFADMGPKPSPAHSLDRINNDLGYFPENCRWATPTEQQNNTRTNRFVVVLGERMTITQACRKHRVVSSQTARCRLNRGWDDEAAVLQKVCVQ